MSAASATVLLADPCGESDWVCSGVYDATANEALASALSWMADKPLRILVIVVLAWLANFVLRHLVRNSISRAIAGADRLSSVMPATAAASSRRRRSEARVATLSTVAASMTTAVVVFFALTAVLSVLGASLAALIASAGVVGVALGFGAQNLVRDVVAGWFILAEDRYGVGDTIDAGVPAVGVVERVTLRSTRLRGEDATVWHVANGEILRVGNHSQGRTGARVGVSATGDEAEGASHGGAGLAEPGPAEPGPAGEPRDGPPG